MFVSALLPVKTFLTLKFLQKQNINIDKAEKKARRLKDNLSEYQGFNQPKFKYNQIRKQRLWRFLWNECSWKLGIILTKACKGIQCFEKLYTAIMKPLPLKLIPSQVLSQKFTISATTICSSTYYLLLKKSHYDWLWKISENV